MPKAPCAPALDSVEVLLWTVAFGASAVAGIWVLTRKEWVRPFAIMVGAIAIFLLLLFGRPPLWSGVLLDTGLVVALLWMRRAAAQAGTGSR